MLKINPVLIATITMALGCSSARGTALSLDFATNPTLPSSQGFAYLTQTATPESSVFSVSGGLLHMNTLGTQAVAFYVVAGAFDATLDTTLEITAKVYTGTTSAGFDSELDDGPRSLTFYLDDTGIDLPDGVGTRRFVAFTTTDSFHTFTMVSNATAHTFNFYTDGNLLTTGIEEVAGNTPSIFGFGDGTGADDGHIDIASIRYVNATPEPSTFIFLGTGFGAIALLRARRRVR